MRRIFLKSDLVRQLGQKMPHIPERNIILAVNHIIDTLSHALANNGRIEIRGFGTWCLHHYAEREARNPRTNEKVRTPARSRAHFKMGKELKAQLNSAANTPIKND